jgi:hypothetical protein
MTLASFAFLPAFARVFIGLLMNTRSPNDTDYAHTGISFNAGALLGRVLALLGGLAVMALPVIALRDAVLAVRLGVLCKSPSVV